MDIIINQEERSNNHVIYVHINDRIAGDRIKQIKENHYVIVSAPRPLLGTLKWQGPFTHGIFYAAGTRDEWGKHWDRDDTWEIIQLTNDDSIRAVKAYLERRGYLEWASDYSDKELVEMYNLPWSDR